MLLVVLVKHEHAPWLISRSSSTILSILTVGPGWSSFRVCVSPINHTSVLHLQYYDEIIACCKQPRMSTIVYLG